MLNSARVHIVGQVHANNFTFGKGHLVFSALALEWTILMISVCSTTILDPLATVSVRDSVDKGATIELVRCANRNPVLLMLLSLSQLQVSTIVLVLNNHHQSNSDVLRTLSTKSV